VPAVRGCKISFDRSVATLRRLLEVCEQDMIHAAGPVADGRNIRARTRWVMPDTQQVNFRLSPEHAELVRLFVQRLREGGPSYQREVRLFLLQPYSPRHMSI
jgi:hypothetical protein